MKRRPLKGPIERLASLAAIASLGAQGASPSFAQSPVRPPFIPVNTLHLELPPGMQPLWPIFAQGGRDILFQNGQDRNVWVIGKDGSALHCVTCSLPADLKKFGLGFVHDFPDGKRLLLADGVAASKDLPKANAWVLECGTSLRDCTTPRVLPIDMSADRGPASLFQRRTFHMSPDGSKIGWMEVRSDGTVMVVARLERAGDRYVAADPRVVNPIGPRSDRDDDADRWENLSQLYELKSFTPDGKAILAVGTLGLNIDVLRIELASGQVTRLTANPDWDEDSSLSPDQKSFVVHSWRSQHRLDAIAWIPQLRGFTGLMMGAAIAPFYVSTWEGFQCDLAPWLLSARGDDGGRLLGQPLAVYGDPLLTAGDNVQGQRIWSPDSRMVLLEERTRTRGRASPNRIAIAALDRPATQPVRFAPTSVGQWAMPASLYRGPHAIDRTAKVRGKKGGSATIIYKGHLNGGASTSVTFDRFTDDGATFVSGTMSGASAVAGDGERRGWLLKADIKVTGRHRGNLQMNLNIDNSARPLPVMTGTIHADYDGRVAPPLPALEPCYSTQPKASPLRLALRRSGAKVIATVTGDVYGDVRPVMNATIRWGTLVVRTDANGHAELPAQTKPIGEVVATAGDTFVPVSARLPAT
jgi:hypothetical protein